MLLLLNKCKRKKVLLGDNQGASRWPYRGSTPTHFTGFSHRRLYTADLYAHNLHAPVFPRARIARTLPKLVIDITVCVFKQQVKVWLHVNQSHFHLSLLKCCEVAVAQLSHGLPVQGSSHVPWDSLWTVCAGAHVTTLHPTAVTSRKRTE